MFQDVLWPPTQWHPSNLASEINWRDRLPIPVFLGFPCGSAGKESACNAGDLDSVPGLGRSPGEGKGYQVFWRGEFHGLSRPWDCKESDTPEWLSLSLHFLHDLAFEESQVKGTWTDRKHGRESGFKLYSVLRNHKRGSNVLFNVQQSTLIFFTRFISLSNTPHSAFKALDSTSLFVHPTSIYLVPISCQVWFFSLGMSW